MKKKVLISSYFLWDNSFFGTRVGLHFLGDFFLKNGYEIFWLTIPFSLLRFVKPTKLKDNIKKLKIAFKKGEIHKENNSQLINGILISLFQPISFLPLLRNEFVFKNYLNLSFPSLRSLLKKYDFENPDIFMSDCGGAGGDILQFIKPKFTIYRLNDLIEGFDNITEGHLKLDKYLLKKSDLVLPTSNSLFNYAIGNRESNGKIYLLPNGVNINKFSEIKKEPLEYKNIPKPRVLYVGALYHWFDWDLLIYTAKKNRDLSFIIIGPGKKPNNLPPNVFFVGPIAYQRIPPFMQHADVGLIPFKNLLMIREMGKPIKFYEYLASGLPVVSTSYGTLKDMAPYALFGNRPEEFSNSIKKALKYTEEEKNKLRETAKQFSWDKIYKKLENILKENNIFS